MSALDDNAIAAIEGVLRGRDRRERPAALKALMRLTGNALAALTHHDEAASEHIRLGRKHSERGARR